MTLPFDPSLLNAPGAVFVDDRERSTSFLFAHPVSEIVAHSTEQVPPALDALDAALASGQYAAGYIGYEAGLGLDAPLRSRHRSPLPLVWLGVYDRCVEVDANAVDLGPSGDPDDVRDVRTDLPAEEFMRRVGRVREHILAGDVYQVNLTCRVLFRHAAPARALFARLRAAHPVGHSAFVNLGGTQIVSLSPELFLRREGGELLARPMKGTTRRGRWLEEDREWAARLAASEKDRAENLMIVDLMRSDLGRITAPGGVSVPRLFAVERYGTVHQMTSDVLARLRHGVTAGDILRATFPPGSVTGAPKIRAMQIIDELETCARGVYCGAIGFFRPGGDLLLNVAIRTIVQTGEACGMGVGAGIVADSEPRAEWEETLLKSRFLHARADPFGLFETLFYRPRRGYAYFGAHLDRLERSAAYFGLRCDRAWARRVLREAVAGASGSMRVRLTVAADGQLRVQARPADPAMRGCADVLLADRRVDPSDAMLYHKTTRRADRDGELAAARAAGFYEVLYLNTEGQVTEGAVTNVVAEMYGERWTPALRCGLLPGVWRQRLLDRGEARERVLTLDDLRRATRLWVGNSVRGARQVRRVVSNEGAAIWARQTGRRASGLGLPPATNP